jgi:hypothetical protein
MLHRWQKNDVITAFRLNQMRDRLRGITQTLQRGRPGTPARRYGRIVEVIETDVLDAHDNPVKWYYRIQEVVKVRHGYTPVNITAEAASNTKGTWVWFDLIDGYVGYAHNLADEFASGTGIAGDGVDHDGDGFESTYMAKPVPVGRIVAFDVVITPSVAAGGSDSGLDIMEAVFDLPHATDGVCPEPEE